MSTTAAELTSKHCVPCEGGVPRAEPGGGARPPRRRAAVEADRRRQAHPPRVARQGLRDRRWTSSTASARSPRRRTITPTCT